MLRYIMIRFHAVKGPQKLDWVPSPPSEYRIMWHSSIYSAHKNVCTKVPKLHVTFAGETHVRT